MSTSAKVPCSRPSMARMSVISCRAKTALPAPMKVTFGIDEIVEHVWIAAYSWRYEKKAEATRAGQASRRARASGGQADAVRGEPRWHRGCRSWLARWQLQRR